MAEPQRFRINRPDVIHETLDGELVIVNLRSGSYYSLDTVGAAIWSGIERGGLSEQIVRDVGAQFDGDASEIETATHALLAELQRERLIVADGAAAVASAPPPIARRQAFAPPRLQKYTDMQELLLLDPIHEVDEGGWPTRGT